MSCLCIRQVTEFEVRIDVLPLGYRRVIALVCTVSTRSYFFDYLFDVSNKRLLLIGMYFDAELISEVDVNLGTP